MNLHRTLTHLLTALIGSGATVAHADIVTYTSSSAFFAAAGSGLRTETYEGLPLNALIGVGTTLNGVTYVSMPSSRSGRIDNTYNRIGNQSLAAFPPIGTGYFFNGDAISVTFQSAVDAVGIYFNANLNPVNTYSISTSVGSAGNGERYDFSTLYFVGLISDTPFTSATFGSAASNAEASFTVDNMSFGLVNRGSNIPEPSSLALLGLAMSAIATRKRRPRYA